LILTVSSDAPATNIRDRPKQRKENALIFLSAKPFSQPTKRSESDPIKKNVSKIKVCSLSLPFSVSSSPAYSSIQYPSAPSE
jgi:hypothetical protein